MPGRWMHRVPGHGAKATPIHRLSGRQPGQARRGIAPLITTSDTPAPGTSLPPLVHPRPQGPTRGAPPLTTLPLPAGTLRQAGGCIQPVLLRGRVDHIDGATGDLTDTRVAERAQHQRDHATTDSLWPTPEDDTTLDLAHWRFAGQGQPPITPPYADATRSGTPPLGPPEGGQP